jgi:hypothetical protein
MYRYPLNLSVRLHNTPFFSSRLLSISIPSLEMSNRSISVTNDAVCGHFYAVDSDKRCLLPGNTCCACADTRPPAVGFDMEEYGDQRTYQVRWGSVISCRYRSGGRRSPADRCFYPGLDLTVVDVEVYLSTFKLRLRVVLIIIPDLCWSMEYRLLDGSTIHAWLVEGFPTPHDSCNE